MRNNAVVFFRKDGGFVRLLQQQSSERIRERLAVDGSERHLLSAGQHLSRSTLVNVCCAATAVGLFTDNGIGRKNVLGQIVILAERLDRRRDDALCIAAQIIITLILCIFDDQAAHHRPNGTLSVMSSTIAIDPKVIQAGCTVETPHHKLHGLPDDHVAGFALVSCHIKRICQHLSRVPVCPVIVVVDNRLSYNI